MASAQPARCLPPHLPRAADIGAGRLWVVGAGKAAAAMARAVEDHWDGDPQALGGLVVTRYGHEVPCARIEIVAAAHPVPDAAGWRAAERVLASVQGLSAADTVLCLLSGGGSALWPLALPGMVLAEQQALARALLASGARIGEINCLRRHLSALQGGRLAAACYPARVLTLLISDVPGDDPADIASGPTVADPSTCADALAIVQRYRLQLPPAALALLHSGQGETLKPGDARLARSELRWLATPQMALEAAAAAARAAGFPVAATGTGGLQSVLDAIAPACRLLRIAGDERVPLTPPEGVIVTEVVAYESLPLPLDPAAPRIASGKALVLLHSAATARHFAAECDRLSLPRGAVTLAALGPRIAGAAGGGWAAVHIAASPDESTFLQLAFDLCEQARSIPGTPQRQP